MPDYAQFPMIENYIYLYHVDKFIILPGFPDSINDQIQVNYNKSTPMSRSAPIYSYANSGPRSLQIDLDLHRDMMIQINRGISNYPLQVGEDYVDVLIRDIQAAALPAYNAGEKIVDPPMVAVRFGNDVFIKGVVTGAVGVTYEVPILDNNKYAKLHINFTVEEVDPYGANQVMTEGSFRGLDTTLERNTWKTI